MSPRQMDLEHTFLALDGRGGVLAMPVGPNFWANIDQSPAASGTLVGVFTASSDWRHWEMHPEGDEVLVLLEGRLEMLMEQDGAETVHAFRPGETLIVPAGVWHRARVLEPGRMLAMTYGAGTQHRPVGR